MVRVMSMESNDTSRGKAEMLDERISEIELEIRNLNKIIGEQDNKLEKQAEIICKLDNKIDEQRKQINSHSERIDRNSNSILDRPDSVKQSMTIGAVLLFGLLTPIYEVPLFQGPIWNIFSILMTGASGTHCLDEVV